MSPQQHYKILLALKILSKTVPNKSEKQERASSRASI